jgi:hypothetical protein
MPKLAKVGSVSNFRIVTIFSLFSWFTLAPRAVFGDVHLRDVALVSAANTREVQDERDPEDAGTALHSANSISLFIPITAVRQP